MQWNIFWYEIVVRVEIQWKVTFFLFTNPKIPTVTSFGLKECAHAYWYNGSKQRCKRIVTFQFIKILYIDSFDGAFLFSIVFSLVYKKHHRHDFYQTFHFCSFQGNRCEIKITENNIPEFLLYKSGTTKNVTLLESTGCIILVVKVFNTKIY